MMAALPYSIGAQVAYPDRQLMALTGDGSLTMMMGELPTGPFAAAEPLGTEAVGATGD